MDDFSDKVAAYGAEVRNIGDRVVENLSSGINRIRDQEAGDRAGDRDGDRDRGMGGAGSRFWGGRCKLSSQCSYLTLGHTNLQVSSCDTSTQGIARISKAYARYMQGMAR